MNTTPTYGPPRTRRTKIMAWLCASMMAVMLLTQLFSYEDFASILAVLLPFNDQQLISLAAAAIVLTQLLALPYLLGMYLSTLMRTLSAACGVLVCGFWLLTSLTNAHAGNSGLFSTTLELPGGAIAALWALLLAGLFIAVVGIDSRFRHDASS